MKADHDPKFEILLDYVKRSRGFDFVGYKRSSLMRRVEKRMQAVNLKDFVDYVDFLEVHPEEFSYLFNTILINVTAFFRDETAWAYLAKEVVGSILASKRHEEAVRIWSAACASGQEAYTLAIVFCEAMGPEAFRDRVKIYATDVDEEALAQARQATYTAKQLGDLSPGLQKKYFEGGADQFVFRADLRRTIIFGRHDLIQDAPISRLDLLTCRNTLMYLNAETQERILDRFRFALNNNGYLFLGRAEMLLTRANLFKPVDVKNRMFRKAVSGDGREGLLLSAQPGDRETGNDPGRHVRLRELSLDTTPGAQIVVDAAGTLVLANEQARILFGLTVRDHGRPLQDLEISYRPVELRSLIEQAYTERRRLRQTAVERRQVNDEVQYFECQVVPLYDNGAMPLGVSIIFSDVTRHRRLEDQLRHSQQELETSNEELQSAQEELETTNEELQSSNEELETTNEELQSSNEELETMNEELQSTNEELQTLNDELRERTVEVGRTNFLFRSVLGQLWAGIAVVDEELKVMLWSARAQELWGLTANEVVGQPIESLDIGLPTEPLMGPLRRCLDGGSGVEFVIDATNRRGQAIKCFVTCSPLLQEDKARGALLLMRDMQFLERKFREKDKDPSSSGARARG